MRSAPRLAISALFALLALAFAAPACSTAAAALGADPARNDMGRNYFDSGFDCRSELDTEKNKDYEKLYLQHRAVFAADNAQRGRAFAVVAGDSLAALWTPQSMQRDLPGIDAVNRGIGGDTTKLFLSRLELDILSLRPRALILSIGGNDILGGRCLDEALANTEAIIASVQQKSPGTTVILTSVPPVLAWKANAIVPFYNQQLRYIAEGDRRVRFADLWPELSDRARPLLVEEYRRPHNLIGYDPVHFNDAGYKVWGRKVMPILRELQ